MLPTVRSVMMIGLLSLWLSLLSIQSPCLAATQSQFKILGVTQPLTQIGVQESWDQHCEIRIYDKNKWQIVSTTIMPENTPIKIDFETTCNAFGKAYVKEHALYEVEWDTAEISPNPPAIKDASGNILPTIPLLQEIPDTVKAVFTLPDQSKWEALLLHTWDSNPTEYQVVFRPEIEPIAYWTAGDTYQPGQKLLSPLKLLINNQYGLMTLIWRDYRQTDTGMRYQYTPMFLTWPAYEPLALDEAKRMLLRASAYTMSTDEYQTDENTLAPNYRAFMRLKKELLNPNDLVQAIADASSAGKLYFLALLHAQNPQQYNEQAKKLLKATPETVEVIEMTGRDWTPKPLVQLVQQQAHTLQQQGE